MKFSEAIWWFIPIWNKTFLLFSVISLHLDPLFFYISYLDGTQECIDVDHKLKITLCVLRTFTDLLYPFHIFIHFWSANRYYFHDLLSLSIHSYDWARCYQKAHFVFDLLVSLPLPQLALLVIIPNLDESSSFMMRHLLKLIIICQFVSCVVWLSLLYQRVTKSFGFLNGAAWAGAALNFFVYVLASHVVGALWYLFAIESQLRCWSIACKRENSCDPSYLLCGERRRVDFGFLQNSCPLLERNQIKDSTNFDFGIFLDALQTHMLETSDLPRKLLYCSWWGLQSLSSLGQGLKPSSCYGVILFSYVITVIGLILLALIIGNMQKYLQTFSHLTLRLEEMKEARRDAEEFMSCVSLPEELRQRVRRYKHYKWKITKGVELDTIVRDLPRDIRRDIKRHLCLPSLHRVEFFADMEDKLLDVTCELMKPVFYTRNSQITRVGYPIGEMVFITSGRVNMTNGYSVELYFGCFFGEEIVEWVLRPESSSSSGVLPVAFRTVTAITDVQAFALGVEEMKFLTSHFNDSTDSTRTRLKHTLKYCQREKRIWAVNCIQVAWRSHCRRKQEEADYIEAAWRR